MSRIQAENCCNAAGVTCEDDGVEAGFAPQLHEVNHIPEAQRRVTGEHDARLTELTAEVTVDARVVLQLVGLDQLRRIKQCRNHTRSRQDKSSAPQEKQKQDSPLHEGTGAQEGKPSTACCGKA